METKHPLTSRSLVALALLLAACGGGSEGTGGSSSTTTTTETGGSGGSTSMGGAGGAGVDECATGAAMCDPNADCVDTPAWYECVCKPGYTGDGKTCADVDECQTFLHDCDPNATCTNTPGGFSCSCPSGFVGDGKSCHATYTAIATGQFHACAIRSDKTAWCWGHNTSGQVGTGTTDPLYLRPAQAGNGTDWVEIVAGGSFTCAREGSGQISCWGAGAGGRLGDGTTTNKSSPTPIAGGFMDWTQLAAGANHACAVRQDGSLYCWGTNLRGQIGDGTNTDATSPTLVSAGPWHSVSTGSEFTCAVKGDHTLWCWGLDTSRQLGDGKTTNSNVPVQEKSLATDWASVSAGNAYACGVKQDGTRWCWGTNSLGQGADGTQTSITEPKAVDADTDWGVLSAGDFAGCALKSDQTLWCWGDGSVGQTGQPGAESLALVPVKVGTEAYTKISSGQRFACGLRADGIVRCWGSATRAALGLGFASDRSDPTPVGSANDWAQLSVQLDDGCGIRQNGNLYCWGRNVYGELGDGTYLSRVTPTPVGVGKVWKRVAVGRSHTCGIASDAGGPDSLYCWGYDSNGEQGNGSGNTPQILPTLVTAPTSVPAWIDIAAGLNHTCAVGSDNTLWCWGRNSQGQLGDGTTTAQSLPKQVLPAGAADWKSVSASGEFTCGLRGSGQLWCWGRNDQAQLGGGDVVSPVKDPQQVGTATYTALSAGQNHACAVRNNGTLWCWGLNTSGQIGVGNSASPVLSPTQITTTSDWATPALGQGTSTCAIKQSGELWCWGTGSYGQLGLGSLSSFNTPRLVPSLTPWKAASYGNEHTCAISTTGQLSCWGASHGAQLGDGVPFVSTPTPILDPQ
jgi:alpha-tubulin suppressor-like RCC1 family protein